MHAPIYVGSGGTSKMWTLAAAAAAAAATLLLAASAAADYKASLQCCGFFVKKVFADNASV